MGMSDRLGQRVPVRVPLLATKAEEGRRDEDGALTNGKAPHRRKQTLLIAALVSMLAVLCLLVSSAYGEDLPILYGSFGPDGSSAPKSNFQTVGSTAVDQQTHDVYVLDHNANALYKFDEKGKPVDWGGAAPYISGNKIEGLSTSEFFSADEVAVNSQTHVVYVTSANAVRAFTADGEAAPFTAGPAMGTSEITGFSELFGVAVDASGDIYAADRGTDRITIYSAAGEPITQFSAEGPRNLAVAPNGAVYVIERFGSVRRFDPSSSLPVEASTTYTPASSPLDEHPDISVTVDPANGNVFLLRFDDENRAQIAIYDSSGTFLGAFATGGDATFEIEGEEGELGTSSQGIAVGANHKVYVGDNGENFRGSEISKVEIFGPFPVLRPTVESSSALEVSADFARLRARINPNTLDTTYYFEFGLSDCSATPNPCAKLASANPDIGSGHTGVWVFTQLPPLQAATTYHYRVVAENSLGVTAGPDRTFTTQIRGLGDSLSDSRAWEMVSPPDKHGGLLRSSADGLVQAAADGRGLVYPSLNPIEAEPEANRVIGVNTNLARRTGAGWESKDIMPPTAEANIIDLKEYKLFSPDLDRAALVHLFPGAPRETPALRENSDPPVYTQLLTSENTPPGSGNREIHSVEFKAANRSLDTLVISSLVPLTTDAPPAGTGRMLYVWIGGQLYPVSKLPASEGGGMAHADSPGSGAGSQRNAVSEDGSRIFWSVGRISNGGNSLSALYLRDTVTEDTVRLDLPEPGATELGDPSPLFLGANPDGTVVFFTDAQQLTVGASPEGKDLYRCVIPHGETAQGCASLTDITVPQSSGESAEVQGLAAGMSEDASRLYFVANGVLDNAANGMGETATAGEPNLYRWQQSGGIRFVAILSKGDQNDWGGNFEAGAALSAAASPDGQYLAFMSEDSLTGQENLDAVSGEPVEEVYRYDDGQDALACISCDPAGDAPEGTSLGNEGAPLVDPRHKWGAGRVAAILPQATLNEEIFGATLYQPRAVLDNGRIFFNAVDSLVPADSNGDWDVYQYEPFGAGSCTGSSGGSMASRSGEGCISLLSSGSAEEEAGFLDAGESGDDVFFLTPARLSVTDTDSELDVYDARVGGTAAVLHPPVECAGESCQAPATAPSDPSPASEAFHGAGNPKPCRRNAPRARARRHGRARCAHKRHRRHAKKHHRQSSDKGRAAK
jgi:hypothetical protein